MAFEGVGFVGRVVGDANSVGVAARAGDAGTRQRMALCPFFCLVIASLVRAVIPTKLYCTTAVAGRMVCSCE